MFLPSLSLLVFPIVVLMKFIPGKERVRPYYLEVVLRLPSRSVTEVSIEFDYVFLKWQEYPPDANHGFYIGAAVITALLPIGRNYTGLPQDGSTITSRWVLATEINNQIGPNCSFSFLHVDFLLMLHLIHFLLV